MLSRRAGQGCNAPHLHILLSLILAPIRTHRHRRFKKLKPSKTFPRNEEILALEVLVFSETGERRGVVPTNSAIFEARKLGLDLVAVSPKSNPPVCKVMDFGKFIYQQEKNERKSKARSKKVETKGVRLSLNMGPHDEDVRRKQAQKFLDNGDRVQIQMFLRGREKAFFPQARDKLQQFAKSLEREIHEEGFNKQGGSLSLLISNK